MTKPAAEISLLDGLATTRAIRRFTAEPIPEDDLAAILWHASRAPSGSNRQPFRFLVLRDGPAAVEAKALLGRSFREMWAAKRADDSTAVAPAPCCHEIGDVGAVCVTAHRTRHGALTKSGTWARFS